MRRYEVDTIEQTAAGAATVYGLLRDGSTWPDWSAIDSFELEREGEGEPEGVGAIRIFRNGRFSGRDEVTGFEPNRRFSYIHLNGLPVRDYRAEVALEPTNGGTKIHWHVSFSAKVPGTGWLVHLALTRFIRRAVQGLAAYAAKR